MIPLVIVRRALLRACERLQQAEVGYLHALELMFDCTGCHTSRFYVGNRSSKVKAITLNLAGQWHDECTPSAKIRLHSNFSNTTKARLAPRSNFSPPPSYDLNGSYNSSLAEPRQRFDPTVPHRYSCNTVSDKPNSNCPGVWFSDSAMNLCTFACTTAIGWRSYNAVTSASKALMGGLR